LIVANGESYERYSGWFIVFESQFDDWYSNEDKYYYREPNHYGEKEPRMKSWIAKNEYDLRIIQNNPTLVKELYKEFGISFGFNFLECIRLEGVEYDD